MSTIPQEEAVAVGPPDFTRESLIAALTELAQLIDSHETTIDLALYGPACLLLATPLRPATTTIDAVAAEGQSWIDKAAVRLAERHGWPSTWMTDRARKHLNHRIGVPAHHLLMLRVPLAPTERLRVFVPEWDYLLSLKVSALLMDEPISPQEQQELRHLMRASGVHSEGDLDGLLTRFRSGPCERRRMLALAHAVWWQCSTNR